MAENRHNGGGTGPFSFTFPSIKIEHIKVSVNNQDQASSAYTINNYNSTSGGTVTFGSATASGTNNVRIYRQTDGTNLEHTFQVGSSIKASDLNNSNKQSLFLAEENRESINSLAAGDATGAIQISGSNIVDNSITTGKILDLEVKSGDISSSSSDDTLRAITTDHIRDGAVTDAKLATGITGSKVTPNFGAQNIVTTGLLGSDDITITGSAPTVHLTDSGGNPDYFIRNINGTLAIADSTNSAIKFQVDSSDGHVDLPSHVDIGGGADVTGDLTVTGNTSFNDHVQMFGKDIYMGNGTIISNDSQGAFADRSGDNIDHIWHNDTNSDSNTGWNFVSDGTYKRTGNAAVQAGSIRCYSQDAMMFTNPTDRTINDSDEDDPIHFETVDLQKGGTNDSNSKSRITVSQGGIYLVTCCLSGQVNTHSHSDGIGIVLRKNGSIFPRESAFPVESFGSENGMEWSFTFAITEQFSDNDYLEVVFRNIEGTASATLNKGYFCVTRLH